MLKMTKNTMLEGYKMGDASILFWWLTGVVALGFFGVYQTNKKNKREQDESLKEFLAMTPEQKDERKKQLDEQAKRQAEYTRSGLLGSLNQHMVCPHCQTKGSVRCKPVTQQNVSKTGGIIKIKTVHAKVASTQLNCDICNATWHI